jgi:nucleoid DNA-binding protein
MLNRKLLVDSVAAEVGVAPSVCKQVLDTALNQIVEALQAGESVRLYSFGVFKVIKRAPRRGVASPTRPAELVVHPGRRAVVFKASSKLLPLEGAAESEPTE